MKNGDFHDNSQIYWGFHGNEFMGIQWGFTHQNWKFDGEYGEYGDSHDLKREIYWNLMG